MLPALVLSAGLGTRLDPLTRLLAKPAVPLGRSTLIEHVLVWLAASRVTDIVINLHHRPETITRVVGDGRHLGVSVRYSWEQPLLGSAGGPRRALLLLDAQTFLIVNGDTLCDVDLDALAAAHRASGADVTMAVVPNARPDHYNGIVADARGVVTGFATRGAAEGSWHFVGIQIVDAKLFEALPDGQPADTVHGIYRDLVARDPGRVRVWPTTARFIDVGTPSDYLATALALRPADVPVLPGISETILWPGSRVLGDVRLHRCIVAGVELPDGFRAEQAIVAPSSIVRPGDPAAVRGALAVFPLS